MSDLLGYLHTIAQVGSIENWVNLSPYLNAIPLPRLQPYPGTQSTPWGFWPKTWEPPIFEGVHQRKKIVCPPPQKKHNQNTFGPTEGQNEQWPIDERPIGAAKRKQSNTELMPNPPKKMVYLNQYPPKALWLLSHSQVDLTTLLARSGIKFRELTRCDLSIS